MPVSSPEIEPRSGFARDCIDGLSQSRKSIPCKWLYDDIGSDLFERICSLPEYYPSRAEEALLEQALPALAAALSPRTTLVELGSGASRKTRRLLDSAPAISTYVPIDISSGELDRAARALRADYAALDVQPVHADFLTLGDGVLADLVGPILLFFPGSTLGNLTVGEATRFLAHLRTCAGPGSKLLLGVDLLKDVPTLLAAYDDAAGVTAAFNLNLLARMNRELGCAIELSEFHHRAIWNEARSRIEMHLVARSRQEIAIGKHRFVVDAGETIHTENSHKFSRPALVALFERSGWAVDATWLSPPPAFLLALLSAPAI